MSLHCSKSPKCHLLRLKPKGYQNLWNLSPSCPCRLLFWILPLTYLLTPWWPFCCSLNLLSMFPPRACSQFRACAFSVSSYFLNFLQIITWFLFSHHSILCSNIALPIRSSVTATYKRTHFAIPFSFTLLNFHLSLHHSLAIYLLFAHACTCTHACANSRILARGPAPWPRG